MTTVQYESTCTMLLTLQNQRRRGQNGGLTKEYRVRCHNLCTVRITNLALVTLPEEVKQ